MIPFRHSEGKHCPACETKVRTAHLRLREWWWWAKSLHPTIHISWAYRTLDEQNTLYREGKTKAHWPLSKHNHEQEGVPFSKALDLFLIDDDGVARFPMPFYKMLWEKTEKDRWPIAWGGNFKKFKDGPHFELV